MKAQSLDESLKSIISQFQLIAKNGSRSAALLRLDPEDAWPFMVMNRAFKEAYCFECHRIKEIKQVIGIHSRPYRGSEAVALAVRLDCGHERHGQERIVCTRDSAVWLDALTLHAEMNSVV